MQVARVMKDTWPKKMKMLREKTGNHFGKLFYSTNIYLGLFKKYAFSVYLKNANFFFFHNNSM